MTTDTSPSIAARIATQIRTQGAVTVAEFMRLALGARELGYYTSRDPLGAAGDFITAPEISQMFGEMIGLWCVDTWQRLGSPAKINLVELGPGRGSLMADALRAAKAAPDFLGAVDLHLVEISKPLRDAQARQLAAYKPGWHDSIETLPAGPLIIIANEFFDALPIHQFQMTATGWRERGITLDPDDPARFAWTLLPPGPQFALLIPELRMAPVDAIAEISPASQQVMQLLARRLQADGGAILAIDYGPAVSGLGDSFQALRRHQYQDPLQDVGDADLTAHVDLPRLGDIAIAAGCRRFGPVGQGDFLRALGIETRAAMLARQQSPEVQHEIASALHRLTDDAQMGKLFKVLAVTSPAITDVAGLA